MEISELYKIFTAHPQVTTDSRDCPQGAIFFALKGDAFNGNQFARAALEKGCAVAVIDEPQFAEPADERYIVVGDVLTTLQQLANHHRRQLGTPIIGVTGTNGKTTTKELISAVLAEKFNVLCTQGNFNNHIGVPKTLLRLTREHDIAVVEMGANHPGEIKTLANIVEPDCGIITNVGKAHLEGFGSFEGVVRTKGELYDYLRTKAGSAVFIDNGNEHLLGIAHDLTLIKYGTREAADLSVLGTVESCAPLLKFTWKRTGSEGNASNIEKSPTQTTNTQPPTPNTHTVQTHLIGSYNIYNMLAAAAIGLHFGVSEEQVDHALSHYVPSNNRSQLEKTAHNHLIVDTYNANPTSMNAALANFRDMEVKPKMAILGDMRELGSASAEEHQQVADILRAAHFDTVWLVGEEFQKTDCPFRKFHDVDEVKAEIARQQPRGYYILIKGSNGVKLYQLPELL